MKLPTGMDADAYVAAVRKDEMFADGALDYSGPGLAAPGDMFETWQQVDPGHRNRGQSVLFDRAYLARPTDVMGPARREDVKESRL